MLFTDSDASAGDSARPTPANLVGLLRGVSAGPEVAPEFLERIDAVTEFLERVDPVDRPFLSVLLRTQGRRIEPLKDALLSLSAQTDDDIEILVLLHDGLPEDTHDVRMVVDRLPATVRGRTQLIEVSGGTRARPLNAGVEAASGRYLAVFDDDDLLFANWVEAFRRAAERSPGRLIRAVVANQVVNPEMWPQGQDGFRTSSWPRPEYPDHFDQLQHFLVNFSPFMSWAFPRSLFATFGLRFDEQLQVCEDWDIILRGSMLCGVEDAPELTSIYRRWAGGESSYSSHSSIEWRESEARVIERINASVMMLPMGSMAAIRGMVLHDSALKSYRFLFDGTSLRRPLNHVWNLARPGLRFAIRVRNRLRRAWKRQ